MPDAKFESSCFSIFGDMTSQNFPQFPLFTPENGFNFKKGVFMSRIVYLDIKVTLMSISTISKQRKIFHFQNFLDISMRKEQQQSPSLWLCFRRGLRCYIEQKKLDYLRNCRSEISNVCNAVEGH